MKRILLLLFLYLISIHTHAVLNEKNLEHTLSVLRIELATTYHDLKQSTALLKASSEKQHQRMIETMQKSNQIALMLYSQKTSYTFNLTYACHEASEQYREFTAHMMPYDEIMQKVDMEIARYTELIQTLQSLPPSLVRDTTRIDLPPLKGEHPGAVGQLHNISDSLKHSSHPFLLSTKGQEDREECLKFSRIILRQYKQMKKSFSKDSQHYEHLHKHLKEVFSYAQQRYKDIQKSIFVNGETNYFTTLSLLPYKVKQLKREWEDKYGNKNFEYNHVQSDWRGSVIFGLIFIVIFYVTLSFLISNIIVRIMMKKVSWLRNNEDMQLKMDYIIIAASLILFTIAIMAMHTFMHHNFIIMACQLLVSFYWLVSVIIISLLIRLNGRQIKSTLPLFTPIIMLGFIVIIFRIIFIPNTLVNLIFPPILLIFTIWQLVVLKHKGSQAPSSDKLYSWTSFLLMCTATVVAWSGYVLMSVQIFIWWLIQLAMILTITCAYDFLMAREERYLKKALNLKHPVRQGWLSRDGKNIEKTWFYDFLIMAALPVAIVLSVIFSLLMAADVFDLTEICTHIFFHPFLDIEGVCKLSLDRIFFLAALYFIFNYLCYIIKATYRTIRTKRLKKKNKGISIAATQANFTLFYNVTTFFVWGSYFILALIVLQVPKSGISIVTAGLATGVGFAMKDLMENFFYGISLMTGRLRVGDWIECDGIRGKVDSITYQSTQIITEDGSIIAFLNSALFNKNFENLTRNHFYVKSKINVGIAYGSDIAHVRKLLSDAILKMAHKNASGRDILDTKKGVSVLLTNFGDNSIDLVIIYWTLVSEKLGFDCQVKEVVYNTLNEHHIEIPFPQRDLHIVSSVTGSLPS